MSKITDEQLKELQESISYVKNLEAELGAIEGRKELIKIEFVKANGALGEVQKKLADEYGNIELNIESGEYTIKAEEE
jgi:hypothetical protein